MSNLSSFRDWAYLSLHSGLWDTSAADRFEGCTVLFHSRVQRQSVEVNFRAVLREAILDVTDAWCGLRYFTLGNSSVLSRVLARFKEKPPALTFAFFEYQQRHLQHNFMHVRRIQSFNWKACLTTRSRSAIPFSTMVGRYHSHTCSSFMYFINYLYSILKTSK